MEKTKASAAEGVVSIIINTILFAVKFWAGTVTGSLALTADAWHTLSDSASSVVVVAGAKLSSKKADREHPFGHGRWEQIATLFIAFILGIIGYDFLKQAIVQFGRKEAVHYGTPAIVVTIISIVVKEALARYAFYLAKKTNSESVRADGWHHRTDALSSIVVLAGILIAERFWWIDSVLGAIIALMLFYVTYEISREVVKKLLGEEPGVELIEQVTGIAKTAYPGNLRLHHFHVHNYVTHKEMTFHIVLDGNMTIEEGHKIASEIEGRIERELGTSATIHVEPFVSGWGF
jgi:cation diffusion facilitator family transporter